MPVPWSDVTPTERFAELLARPAAAIPLDELAALIAVHAHPGLDPGVVLKGLDRLADGVATPTLDGVRTHLFTDLGFSGNVRDYYDPRNSYLDDVLDRRLGIPISLAVVMVEVGRRVGVPLLGIAMPGHFLVRDATDPSRFVDPFARGRLLDRAGCADAFHRVQGPDAPFEDRFLEPVSTAAIIGRMLANLRSYVASRGDRRDLAWILRLRTLLPDTPVEERAELASVLTLMGDFAAAAGELDLVAAALGGELGREYRQSSERLRARLN
jgi:regulator of sirC expression with transglutaminase-like and TPR domain